MRSSLPASSNCTTSMPLTATVPSGPVEIPSVAGEPVVRIDGGGALEAVSGVVSQHDVGQSADLGTAVTLERRIEQLAVGIPARATRASRRSASASA